MFIFRRTTFCLSTFILICFFASTAYGLNERLHLSQSGNGEIMAQLSGTLYPCTVAFGKTSITQPSQRNFVLSTTNYFEGCPTHPGDLPFPYSLTADLGFLPDGKYSIAWTFSPGASSILSPVPPQKFVILSGALVTPTVSVPTLTGWGILVFILLSGYGSIYYLRKGT